MAQSYSMSQTGDISPERPCFEGTEVPCLDIKGDEWLSLALPSSMSLDESLVGQLNVEAGVSVGDELAVRRAKGFLNKDQENLRSQAAVSRALSLARRRAKLAFNQQAGVYEPESPFYEESRLTPIRPLLWIATTRLFSRYVTAELPDVIQGAVSRGLYELTTENLRYKIGLMEEAGIGIAPILVHKIRYFNRGGTTNSRQFLQAMRKAAAAIASSPPPDPPPLYASRRRGNADVPVLTDAEQARYAKLAAVIGETPTAFVRDYPGVGKLDSAAFDKLVSGVEVLVEKDRPVRPRDFYRLAPELQPPPSSD